jgi:hypothetical protein
VRKCAQRTTATRNQTLEKSVGITLAGMSNVRKVERGVYQAR